jgi:predicted short-subunit dehydrogenase-like oxidoreductase (DUF2520 family)
MLPKMSARKSRQLKISIVGAGNLATALALSLRAADFKISEIVSRAGATSRGRGRRLARRVRARATVVGDSDVCADVVWLCVPDREIGPCAKSLAALDWRGKIAFHSSGALSSDELASLRRRGARVASVHPMMTFVARVTPSLRAVGFAVEGDREAVAAARKMVAALGGKSFVIAKNKKALYHAWGTLASPLLTALLAISERVAESSGIPQGGGKRWMLPIVRQTIENYAKRGLAQGFSGPIVRGDAAIVRKHLRALKAVPAARAVYLALARSALHTLPARNRKQLRTVLG